VVEVGGGFAKWKERDDGTVKMSIYGGLTILTSAVGSH